MPKAKTGQRAALAASFVVVATLLSACGSSKAVPADDGYTPAMRAAIAAANRIAVDLTTFDYRALDAHYVRMKADATAAFAKNLDATRADTVAFDQRAQVISQGAVIASAARPMSSDGSVTVLLFVDQQLHSLHAKVGQLEQVRVQMVMKDVNGRWLVDRAIVTGSS